MSVEEALRISLSDLKKKGLLALNEGEIESYHIKPVFFLSNFKFTGSLKAPPERIKEDDKMLFSIFSHLQNSSVLIESQIGVEDCELIRIRFSSNEQSYCQIIKLERVPTNLGGSFRYYFICPKTANRCLTLLCPSGKTEFAARQHFKGLRYKIQNISKLDKVVTQLVESRAKLEIYKRLNPRGRKMHNGKLTKHYVRYLKEREKEQRLVEQHHSGMLRIMMRGL